MKYKFFFLTIAIVFIDQASKLLVNHYMYLHEEVNVLGDWFRLHYLLNPGMAFGFKWNNEFGKLILTVFRILAMTGIAYYLVRMIRAHSHPGFLWSLALILGGAIGNVVDSTFYGVMLSNSPPDAPIAWFHGQVIDMLYFPLFEFDTPSWFPLGDGGRFLFFSPVFNIADSSIFIGVMMILLQQKKFFKSEKAKHNPITAEPTTTEGDLPAHEETLPELPKVGE